MKNANDSVDAVRRSIFAEETVREVAAQLSPDQRFVVTMLALNRLHRIDLKATSQAYASERQTPAAIRFAKQIKDGSDPIKALTASFNLLPAACLSALRYATANDGSKNDGSAAFFEAWLAQTTDDQAAAVRHEETFAATMFRILFRMFVVGVVFSFVLIRVIPEFLKMFDEFGIEIPSSMLLVMIWSDRFYILAPVIFLVVFIFVVVYLFRGGYDAMLSYFQRWKPGSWRQVRLSRDVAQRQQLAWKTQSIVPTSLETGVKKPLDVQELFQNRNVSKREGESLLLSGSPETQAWLLRNVSQRRHRDKHQRSMLITKVIVGAIHVALAVIIVSLAVAIFSALITIMEDLV